MTLKFLQLNIFKGKFLNNLIDFVKKENFDILNFQEVAGDSLAYPKNNIFQEIKKQLNYQGELGVSWKLTNQPNSYFGNATFFKNSIRVLDKTIIWLKKYRAINPRELPIQKYPRLALSLLLDIGGKKLNIINAHLAWGPTPKDKLYKLKQAQKLYRYVQKLKEPFVFSGDFNVTPDSQIVSWFSNYGNNLTAQSHISNTLNPSVHRAKELFPKGLTVDYIFTHPSLKVKTFRLIDNPDLSDHYGLMTKVEM